MLLTTLQQQLASFYETPIAYDVADFLITDAETANILSAADDQRENHERLLVRQEEDMLEISLYVDQEILAQLNDDDPYATLHAGNLNAFLIALEGVSHFHYLSWNATHGRTVTLLELELQAEVDKYVTTAQIIADQEGTDSRAGLHQQLFERIAYHTDLNEGELARYKAANYYAAKYCQSLKQEYPGHHQAPSFVNELRRFYRMTQHGKIRRIEHRN